MGAVNTLKTGLQMETVNTLILNRFKCTDLHCNWTSARTNFLNEASIDDFIHARYASVPPLASSISSKKLRAVSRLGGRL